MSDWVIEPIPLHRFKVPGPEVLFQRGFGELIEMVIFAFLLRNGTTNVLVDTGLPPDHAALNANIRARKGPDTGFAPAGAGIVAWLADVGVRPDLIIVTSFGPYAVGGLEHFPDVPLVASARGIADLARPEEPALFHPIPPAAVDALARARTVTGEAELLPGIAFVETGLHHPASAAIIVQTAKGWIAIADSVFTARNLREGLALGAAEYAGGWHRMVRMLGGRVDAILPIHDPDPTPVPRTSWHETLRLA